LDQDRRVNRFPVLEHLAVANYRLYPGTPEKPGIDFSFGEGVTLLAGINGLGKTTLIAMLFRMIVGAFELPKDSASGRFGGAAKSDVITWAPRTKFFAQRVADHALNATAELRFRVGTRSFHVRRSLANLRLQFCTCDGVDLAPGSDESAYQNALCEAADAGQFADFLTAVKYLTFFNEERRDILWDEQAQRQFFRILFTKPQEAREWVASEQQISSADSRARNISASAFQLEQDLKDAERLLLNNAGVDARLAAEQVLLDADLRRRQELELEAERLEGELKTIRRDLERSKLTEDATRREVEELRFTRLADLFPTLTETAQYVLTQLYANGRCLACNQQTTKAQETMEQALDEAHCIVCGSSLDPAVAPAPNQKRSRKSEVRFRESRDRLSAAALQRDALSKEEQQKDSEWRMVLTELGDVAAAVNARVKDVEALRSQLPPAPDEVVKLRGSIKELRERETIEKRKRQSAEVTYGRLLASVNERIEVATSRVSTIFQSLIKHFLEESCKLTFQMISDRPSQSGRSFEYPSLRFEMSAAAFEGEQIRTSPDDVSESQREFIDLAFRMALAEAAAQDKSLSMVVETPEASLDAIFMSRAASMFRTFAKGPRSIIVTSNLTSSVMIPVLMGPATTSPREIAKRRKKVLNLLEVAAPNAALRKHKKKYSEFLEKGLRGAGR
jgi:hypothetical protein